MRCGEGNKTFVSQGRLQGRWYTRDRPHGGLLPSLDVYDDEWRAFSVNIILYERFWPRLLHTTTFAEDNINREGYLHNSGECRDYYRTYSLAALVGIRPNSEAISPSGRTA